MPNLKKFIQPLPVPETVQPENEDDKPYYRLAAKEVKHSFHPDLPETKVWAYGGQLPGPTFRVKKDEPIAIKWENELPYDHFLPVDPTLHGSGELPGGRTAVHVHGARVPEEFDGYPDSWFTKNYEQTGDTFKHKVYEYPNGQRGMTLWYHDHTMGITRLNIYAGMAGFYIIEDESEEKYNLPSGEYDIPIMIQDRSFKEDGSLDYPDGSDISEDLDVSHVEEVYGDTVVVNGKVWPYLEVEPRKYRFRFLNGANSRYFHLNFGDLQAKLIATDQGLVEMVKAFNNFRLVPSERLEMVIDFSEFAGETLAVKNEAPAGYPDGDLEDHMKEVMQFRVKKEVSEPDESEVPDTFRKIEEIPESEAVKTRDLYLNSDEDEYGRPRHLLDGNKWGDPITEDPKLNTVEIWRFINVTDDAHPMHIHLVDFHVLDKQQFDLDHYEETGELKYTSEREKPQWSERGYKDVVNVNPGEAVRVIAKFGPYAGTYVWHCHMIEHEDNDMMRPYKIIE